jgi:fucose-1-phosphate guanylyltransferase
MPNGGVFLCSSDTIELFDESNINIDWLLTDDFVAFAHPSSLSVGTQHGVYVLDPTDKKKCLCVLQKPTIEQMKSHKAIWCHGDNEFVYTDSLYYFNMNIAQRLAEIYRQENPIQCEIDCYGDFMSPLGICPLPRPLEKENDNNNNNNLQRLKIKQKLYDSLFGCHLQVIILHKSSFNHTGTNDEYLDICCGTNQIGDNVFEELKLEKHVGCKVFDESKHDTVDFWNGILPSLPHGDTLHHQPSAPDVHGCVIHSFIHPKCRSAKRSLLEYCCIGIPIEIGENTILSNLTILSYSNLNQNILKLPSNLIMQTISLNNELFATFAFGFYDNMKATYNNNDDKMLYFGQTLSKISKKLHCEINDLFDDDNNKSLWTLKIFPITKNPNESFEKTLKLILSNDILTSKQEYISIKDILQYRDISSIIQYRSNLINCT